MAPLLYKEKQNGAGRHEGRALEYLCIFSLSLFFPLGLPLSTVRDLFDLWIYFLFWVLTLNELYLLVESADTFTWTI